MPGDFTSGLARAAEIAREIGTMAKNCGQTGDGPAAAEAIARAIEAEADREDTPTDHVTTCEACGQLRRVGR